MEQIHDKLQLKQVINASGKMTILGVSKIADDVAESLKIAGQQFFEMDVLMKQTGAYLANLLKTEDAQIVSSASAGIALSVAGVIGKGSKKHLYDPYDISLTSKRQIVLPKGHNVDYGVPIELMVKQGGGVVREAGYANMCTKDHLRAQITAETAAILYVKSHHTVQKSMLTVEEAVSVAREMAVPLIIDAAAEEDVFCYTAAGADLVIYSGAKAFEGPSSGLVIGRDPYVSWVRLQAKGIGRTMKIGKENVMGLVTAMERYLTVGSESPQAMKQRLIPFVEALNQLPAVVAEIVQDGSGRAIYRAQLKLATAEMAQSVIEGQRHGNPAIYTRDYLSNRGVIEYDIRSVDEAEMKLIVTRLQEILKEK
ncbi:MAG: DgaE family pyridoxal phosphate-dependent ammonia lyase [Defluviitaleaceae bacterium]|nr:DgaE family pyridoxal phosphate-dependent ammonia lyase [Defluviitaleaceae bacterium]